MEIRKICWNKVLYNTFVSTRVPLYEIFTPYYKIFEKGGVTNNIVSFVWNGSVERAKVTGVLRQEIFLKFLS